MPKSKKSSQKADDKPAGTPINPEILAKFRAMSERMRKRLANGGFNVPGKDDPEFG